MSEDTLTSEKYWGHQEKIPGSTRVPVDEVKEFIKNERSGKNIVILDIGSGEGRSTKVLKSNFPNSKIVAFDLSHEGLTKTTSEAAGRIQGTALELPFKSESADCVILCGVMTNITDEDPDRAMDARKKVLSEISRVLTPGGVCIISDFNNEHKLSNYPVNYFRHQLITGEYGTIAVFDPAANISFVNKSDDEVAMLAKSPHLQRLAHHYSEKEIETLVGQIPDLKLVNSSNELGSTPSGKDIDTLVVTLRKSKNKI